MRNINTLSKSEYIWYHAYSTLLLFFLYRMILFFPISGMKYSTCVILLVSTMFVSASCGLYLTYHARRNFFSLICNLVLSPGVYFVISFWNVQHSAMVLTALVTLVIVVIYAVAVYSAYRKERKANRETTDKVQWLFFGMIRCRTLVACVLGGLLVSMAIKPILGKPLLGIEAKPDTTVTTVEHVEGETISKNMDTLLLLLEDEWKELNVEKRLDVLKTVVAIETNYLGIPDLNIGTDILEEYILGQYDNSTKTVVLNLTHLQEQDAQTMLKTTCHECFHAYQHHIVDLYELLGDDVKDLYLFRETAEYQKEFDNYIEYEDDAEGYANQLCETDSNEYAMEAMTEYMERIYLYVSEHSGA